MMAKSAQKQPTSPALVDAQALRALLRTPRALQTLFDALDDVVFFVKDRDGRYVFVNDTLVSRVGASDKRALLHHRVDEFFPGELGSAFRQQDERVLRTGQKLRDRLELHLYPGHEQGWCRTIKMPLREGGRIVGLVGFSQDLHLPATDRAPAGVARAMTHIDAHLSESLSVPGLAAIANMATRTFERAVYRLFHVSAGEWIIKARVDAGCRLLRETDQPIAQVALACGYADHSAFTRQFRARTGMTPRAFRDNVAKSSQR
jgi:AraC-like DNA-binding protein